MDDQDCFRDYSQQDPDALTEHDLDLVKKALSEYRPDTERRRSVVTTFAVRAMLEHELEDFYTAELVDDDVCVTRLDGSLYEAFGQAAGLVTNVIAEAEAALRRTP